MRDIKPLAMIPVGAIGERAPATQPCATMRVIKNGEILARSATAMARGAIKAAAAMLPAPIEAMPSESAEEHDRDQSDVPSTYAQRRPDDPVERAVASGQGEQERHSHQGQEQIGRKAAHHVADREPAPPERCQVNPDHTRPKPGTGTRD